MELVNVIHDMNPPRENSVLVDSCIAYEIQQLNDMGVKTLGCCCGHGNALPQCLIDATSISKCINLGYKIQEYSNEHSNRGIYQIVLKSNLKKECKKKRVRTL